MNPLVELMIRALTVVVVGWACWYLGRRSGYLKGLERALELIKEEEKPWVREVGSKQELVGAIHEVVEDIKRRWKEKR